MQDITIENLEAALLDQKIAGKMRDKSYCYTPVFDGEHWRPGIAVEGEAGYNPIVGGSFAWDHPDPAWEFCERMNTHIGLSDLDAARITTSTMRGFVH